MKPYRYWTICFVIVVVVIEAALAAMNHQLDPLWCFGTINRFNASAIIIDQRQQKTSLLNFGRTGYDTLIIGSSRTEPLAAEDFPGRNGFNYSVPALFPDEYPEYIAHFRKRNGDTLRHIYIGLDFFGTIEKKPVVNRPPSSYFVEAATSNFRLNSLLSADPLVKLAKGYLKKEYYYRYDRRKNILIPREMTETERMRFTEKRLAVFRDNFYADGAYHYNDRYKELLSGIAGLCHGLETHVFTTPVSQALFEQMIRQGRYPDYERWLKEVVGVFGSVTHFMTLNSVTTDMGNFYDADHLYPGAGAMVSRRLSGSAGPGTPVDFGDIITRETIAGYLTKMRTRLEKVYGPLDTVTAKHTKEAGKQ